MKKTLIAIIIVIVTMTISAKSIMVDPNMTPLMEKILSRAGVSSPYTNLTQDVQLLANTYGISSNQMAEILEGIVREGLSEIENTKEVIPWGLRRINAYKPIEMLELFQGTNTLALLKECILSEDEETCITASKTYLSILGIASIPFFQEIFEKRKLGNGTSKYVRTCSLFGNWSTDPKRQTSDVEKLYAFMIDLAQTDQSYGVIGVLNRILCANVDGYVNSIQREQSIQRFLDVLNEFDRNYAKGIQDEINRIPTEQRTDLSQGFRVISVSEKQEQQRQLQEQSQQYWIKAKAGDDDALKEVLTAVCLAPHFGGMRYTDSSKELVERGISRERVIKALDSIIRENLSVLDKEPEYSHVYKTADKKASCAMYMLEGLLGEDVLALSEEYITLSPHGIIRALAMGSHSRMKETMRTQQIWERAKAGDDDALKQHLREGALTGLKGSSNDSIQRHMSEDGFSRERIVCVLDSIIRENLFALRDMPEDSDAYKVLHAQFCLAMNALFWLPQGDDILPLFEEYAALPTNNAVHNIAMNCHSRMKKELQSRQQQQPAE